MPDLDTALADLDAALRERDELKKTVNVVTAVMAGKVLEISAELREIKESIAQVAHMRDALVADNIRLSEEVARWRACVMTDQEMGGRLRFKGWSYRQLDDVRAQYLPEIQ